MDLDISAIYEDELIEEPHRPRDRDRKHRETKGAATYLNILEVR